MADLRVTCIKKPHGSRQHEHITHLGNPSSNWTHTVQQIIQFIDSKTHTFYVIDPINLKRSNVEVVRPPGKPAYVRTRADGDLNDNLLSLPQCS